MELIVDSREDQELGNVEGPDSVRDHRVSGFVQQADSTDGVWGAAGDFDPARESASVVLLCCPQLIGKPLDGRRRSRMSL
jgi:hypothetical protein